MAGKASYSRTQLFGIVAVTAVVTSVVVGGGLMLAGAGTTPNKYYACAKNSAVVASTIRVNTKPTCPSGQKLVVWSQIGPKGATGAAGVTGATGPQGPEAQLGTFAPTQIVAGAVLTCSSATSTHCDAPLLNGLGLWVPTNGQDTMNRICATVRGTVNAGFGGGPSSMATRVYWDGSKWSYVTGNFQLASYIDCA